jgi:hypothetical protein
MQVEALHLPLPDVCRKPLVASFGLKTRSRLNLEVSLGQFDPNGPERVKLFNSAQRHPIPDSGFFSLKRRGF